MCPPLLLGQTPWARSCPPDRSESCTDRRLQILAQSSLCPEASLKTCPCLAVLLQCPPRRVPWTGAPEESFQVWLPPALLRCLNLSPCECVKRGYLPGSANAEARTTWPTVRPKSP